MKTKYFPLSKKRDLFLLLCYKVVNVMYTKTDLVFGFTGNQILVAVIPGQKPAEDFSRSILYWILSDNHYQMSILTAWVRELQLSFYLRTSKRSGRTIVDILSLTHSIRGALFSSFRV